MERLDTLRHEVEIDLDTCIVQLVNYTAVDDVGTVINPMIARGPAARRNRSGG
jgi:Molybdopterin cofactor-binding domain